MLTTGLACTAAGAARLPYRDPFLQPFASSSLWNTSLGSGSRWSAAGDADTIDLRHAGPGINAGHWSMPYFIGSRGDLPLEFQDWDTLRPVATAQIAAPATTHAALPPDGDRHIIVFDPSKRWMYHYFACDRTRTGFGCALAQKDDTCGAGLGSYGWGTGVMRRWEIAAGRIDHMLRFSLPVSLTRSGTTRAGGPAWPATGEDSFGATRYTGHVLYGSTIGLPPDIDIGALGLSPPGRVLAEALQDYGALQRDTGGNEGLLLYAEEAAEGMPQLDAMRADLPKIVPHLALLRNQAPATPNGGGVRRRPPVAPLDPQVCRLSGSGRRS